MDWQGSKRKLGDLEPQGSPLGKNLPSVSHWGLRSRRRSPRYHGDLGGLSLGGYGQPLGGLFSAPDMECQGVTGDLFGPRGSRWGRGPPPRLLGHIEPRTTAGAETGTPDPRGDPTSGSVLGRTWD